MSDARVVEERHGFPGALRAWGGVGGHVVVPHVDRCDAHLTQATTVHAGLADPGK